MVFSYFVMFLIIEGFSISAVVVVVAAGIQPGSDAYFLSIIPIYVVQFSLSMYFIAGHPVAERRLGRRQPDGAGNDDHA